MKNNRRNSKLTYIGFTNICPYLRDLKPHFKRQLVKEAMRSVTHFALVKAWAAREKYYRDGVKSMAASFKDMRENARKIIELHPEFLEDPAIRAGIEKNYPRFVTFTKPGMMQKQFPPNPILKSMSYQSEQLIIEYNKKGFVETRYYAGVPAEIAYAWFYKTTIGSTLSYYATHIRKKFTLTKKTQTRL